MKTIDNYSGIVSSTRMRRTLNGFRNILDVTDAAERFDITEPSDAAGDSTLRTYNRAFIAEGVQKVSYIASF